MKNSQCSCGSYHVIPSVLNAKHWSCLECFALTPYNFDESKGLPCRCGLFEKKELNETTDKCKKCGYESLKNWKADLNARPRHKLRELFEKYGIGVKVCFHNRPETWYFQINYQDSKHSGLFRGVEFKDGVEINDRAYWGEEADDIGWYVVGK